jgi:twitching motility two-component system response regulator PilH
MDALVANTAEDGIKVAQLEQPDAILMDVVMPGMNGFQATRFLSKDPKTSHIPIIILTTKGAETDRVWGMRQGARDYLVKPVEENELISRLKMLTSE